ncbi:hypothetical protein SISSUDRAFT_1060849 [Sistotremastrum suecicum HHB10207 ss-3]|uniref:Uncharacterized protein n=1 Tax=Sistotremastrum suecicum HHB10207 ss-3 TaxID=1314776 RepID=A0A166EP06_9AGAM|nr:hypothetical protein SISSUDRAFT_1060849 [Sistotremastrum suecicum HHB10207 ss-3]
MSHLVQPSVQPLVPLLDPKYYYSSLFVDAFTEDLVDLLRTFHDQYTLKPPPRHAFDIFKDIWRQKGWNWIHLKELTDAPREAFLDTCFRIFVTHIACPPFHENANGVLYQIGALFALYTLYFTQPSVASPKIWRQHHISIPIDYHASLHALPSLVSSDLTHYVIHVLSRLLESHAFYIIPASDLEPFSPVKLPHSILKKVPILEKGKSGRKNKQQKGLLALEKLKRLEALADGGEPHPVDADDDALASYLALKQEIADTVPSEDIKAAEDETMSRLRRVDVKTTEKGMETGREGLIRAEDAAISPSGLLGLIRSH